MQNLNQLDVTSKDATADDQKAKEEKRGWKRSNKLSNRKVHFVIQLIYNKKELIEISCFMGISIYNQFEIVYAITAILINIGLLFKQNH